MTVHFLAFERREPALPTPALPDGLTFHVWRPGREGRASALLSRPSNLAWWAMERLHLFARRGFAEVTVRRGPALAQRLIVTPKWRRFPFMSESDLQIGDVWTAPAERGKGLARTAIAKAQHMAGLREARLWYLAESGNLPSVRLAEACGFSLVGTGRRTRPLGLALLGQFDIEDRVNPV